MSKSKIVTVKVVVGIICALLICGFIFMTAVLFSGAPSDPTETIVTIPYYNLPNICGDDCVYVSDNFFVENNLQVPQEVVFKAKRKELRSVSIKIPQFVYYGRQNELKYQIDTISTDIEQNEKAMVWIACDPKNISKLENKQQHGDYTYELQIEDIQKTDDNDVMEYWHTYKVNFNRNENSSKKCQLTMSIKIEHSKEISTTQYKERCDKMFFSLLDNVVNRNV